MVRPPANLNRYTQLPAVPRGYPLGDLLSVIVPESTINLVLNPSVERGTTGYTASNGSSIARSTTYQARGAYSLAVTPSSNVNSGVYYTPAAVTSTQVYTFSVDVWGAPGVPMRIAITDGSGTILNRLEFRGEGRWRRYSINATPGTTSIRLYVEKNNSASTAIFYVDGLQLEAKAYPTTYCDGDLVGFIPTRADFYWTGTPHASASVRSAQTRAGGRVMRLSKYGFTLMGLIGLGMLNWANVDTPTGLQGGSYYQRSVPQQRQFTIMGDLREVSRAQLDRRQASLIDVLRPDLVTPTQPLVLRYQLVDECSGEPLGDALDIECSLEPGGPGNTVDNNHQESLSLAFKQYVPVIQSELESGASLGVNTTVANASYILQRSATGAWGALNTGLPSYVMALAYGNDLSLYVGGFFTNADGIAAADYIAKWNESAWSALGTGAAGSGVNDLVVGPDGSLYAAGEFTSMGGVANTLKIAKWDGSAWSALGTGVTGFLYALAVGTDGTLYAGGDITNAGGTAVNDIAKWNGSAWSALGTGLNGTCLALVVGPDGSLYAGGEFTTAGGTTVNGVAKWDGSTWSALGTGLSGGALTRAFALAIGPDGSLYAAGEFTSAGGVAANYIARWNGTAWSPLGTGLGGVARSLAFTPQGTLWVGGSFTTAGGLTLTDRIAQWNGSTWLMADVDLPGTATITALAIDRQGVLTLGYDTSGSATAASVTSVTVGGSRETWARIEFVGPGTLTELVNTTTGAAIYFNLTLLSGERAVLNLRPDRISFVSTFRGDISNTILPGSQETNWRLQKGANTISVYMSGTDANSAAILTWRTAHGAVQSATP